GLIDTHVHLPQVRAIGHLGRPLLDWLDHCALPEEAKLSDDTYAAAVAEEFLTGLTAAGTTSAMVVGAHVGAAMDIFLSAAATAGLRTPAGLVTSDRTLPEARLTDGEASVAEGQRLSDAWHGAGRLRYAVTPRFSCSAGPELLAAGGALVADNPDIWVTSHINENRDEVTGVAQIHPEALDYLDTYDRAGLLGRRTVLAHNVHPQDRELARMAE